MAQIRNGVVGDWRLSDEEFLASFRLPSDADKHETLQATHPLIREGRIKFDEITHTYTVDGIKVPISVTGLIHQFSFDFDPFSAIETMKANDWETKTTEVSQKRLRSHERRRDCGLMVEKWGGPEIS